jgi:hypothetical protein
MAHLGDVLTLYTLLRAAIEDAERWGSNSVSITDAAEFEFEQHPLPEGITVRMAIELGAILVVEDSKQELPVLPMIGPGKGTLLNSPDTLPRLLSAIDKALIQSFLPPFDFQWLARAHDNFIQQPATQPQPQGNPQSF